MITVGYPFTLASCDHVSATFQPDFFRPRQFFTSSDCPSSSIRLLIDRQLHHFPYCHRTIPFVTLFSDYNAVRRLPVLWTTTVPRHVLIVALGVHVSVVPTRTLLLYEARRKRVVLGGGGRRRS